MSTTALPPPPYTPPAGWFFSPSLCGADTTIASWGSLGFKKLSFHFNKAIKGMASRARNFKKLFWIWTLHHHLRTNSRLSFQIRVRNLRARSRTPEHPYFITLYQVTRILWSSSAFLYQVPIRCAQCFSRTISVSTRDRIYSRSRSVLSSECHFCNKRPTYSIPYQILSKYWPIPPGSWIQLESMRSYFSLVNECHPHL